MAYSVSLKPMRSNDFIDNRGERKTLVKEKEFTLLTYGKSPYAFVMPCFEGGGSTFGIDGEVETINRKTLHDNLDSYAEIDVAYLSFNNARRPEYMYWSVPSFLKMVSERDDINVLPQMMYYLRNDLEKPLYKNSPTFTFSEEGFLTEYASVFGRFSGPTANIVTVNHLPVKVQMGRNDSDSFLLLPETESVMEKLERFSQHVIEREFYMNFVENMQDLMSRFDNGVTYFSGKIYDKTLLIVPMSAGDSLYLTACEAASTLQSKSDSIPRNTQKKNRKKDALETQGPFVIEKQSKDRQPPKGVITMPPPDPDHKIDVPASKLKTLQKITGAFEEVRSGVVYDKEYDISGENIRITSQKQHIGMVRHLVDSNSSNVRAFSMFSSFLPHHTEIVNEIMSLKNASSACVLIEDEGQEVAVMSAQSDISMVCSFVSREHT